MMKRRREMSSVELRCAERSLLDDGRMEGIIREGVGFLDFKQEELEGVEGRVARLRVPEKLFGRSAVGDHAEGDEGGGVNAKDLPSPQGNIPPKSQSRQQQSPSKRVRIGQERGSDAGTSGAAVAQDKPTR